MVVVLRVCAAILCTGLFSVFAFFSVIALYSLYKDGTLSGFGIFILVFVPACICSLFLSTITGLLFELPKTLWFVRHNRAPFVIFSAVSVAFGAVLYPAITSVQAMINPKIALFSSRQDLGGPLLFAMSGFISSIFWWVLVVRHWRNA